MDPLDLSRFFEQHPVLETERLLLRQVQVSDAKDLHAYFSDAQALVHISKEPVATLEETETILSWNAGYLAARESFRFAIVLKENGTVIGTIDFHNLAPEHHRMEIGYFMTRAAWGRGYMTEAIREVIRFAFEEMGFHRIEAECETENIRSIRVLERCGMSFEATLRENEINKGRFVSNHVYAILNSDTRN